MANYYRLERDLIVNNADGSKQVIEAGKYVITEATGLLSGCDEAELQANIDRVDVDIVERNAAIEAARLAAEQAAQEEPQEEPPIAP